MFKCVDAIAHRLPLFITAPLSTIFPFKNFGIDGPGDLKSRDFTVDLPQECCPPHAPSPPRSVTSLYSISGLPVSGLSQVVILSSPGAFIPRVLDMDIPRYMDRSGPNNGSFLPLSVMLRVHFRICICK
ncbi:hypothetical protein J6590_056722 [Homalodisca vitripennis]|nr:hypothetical protein J6590_056722 [Homalodisca vitripennis]